MIDLLRFIGVMNAAVWFGSAVYHLLGVGPAANSDELRRILGAANAPYYAGIIEQLLTGRLFWVNLVCGSIAVAHAFAEWVYLGRTPSRWWAGLLGGLLAVNLVGGMWVHPYLSRLHVARYAVNFPAERRQVAARTYVIWNVTAEVLRGLALVGTGVYFWRTVNPPASTRFSSAVKFRS